MLADNPGTWLFHCHLNDHMDGGMMALFHIKGTAPTITLDGKVRGLIAVPHGSQEVGGQTCGCSAVPTPPPHHGKNTQHNRTTGRWLAAIRSLVTLLSNVNISKP
jgi:hypothetical protein